MKAMKPIYVTQRLRKFTGDTGCSEDWQIGFEDQCGGYCDFLGIGNKKEAQRRADVLAEVTTKYYPDPAKCVTGSELMPKIKGGVWSANATWENQPCGSACQYATEGIPNLRKDIAENKRKVDTGQDTTVAPRYVDAFNQALGTYTSYYNNNCLTATPAPAATTPASTLPYAPGSTNADPILQTATPTGSATAATNGTTTGPTGASTGTTGSQGTGTQKPAFKVPTWAWWTAGGIAAIGLGALLLKKKSA